MTEERANTHLRGSLSEALDVGRLREAIARRPAFHGQMAVRDLDLLVEVARDMATVVTTSLVPCQCPRGQRAGAGVEHVADCPLLYARAVLDALDGDTQ